MLISSFFIEKSFEVLCESALSLFLKEKKNNQPKNKVKAKLSVPQKKTEEYMAVINNNAIYMTFFSSSQLQHL